MNDIGKLKRRRNNNRLLKAALVVAFLIIAALVAILITHKDEIPFNIITGTGNIITAVIKDKDANAAYSYYDGSGGALLTPYTDHGCGTGTMCEVIAPYGECTFSATENNLSDPLCSALVRGTVDRVVSVGGTAENPIYHLASGLKINDEYLKVTENAYCMPENTLTYESASETMNGWKLVFQTTWAVPVQVTLSPQEYYTGYLERIYNVEQFTAKYMDIKFFDTSALEGSPDVSGSDVIKKCEWIEAEDGGMLRLYLQSEGRFYGYSYTLDKNGRFTFVIKKNIRTDAAPTVMLDAGHGGSDPGASDGGNTVIESGMTLDIAGLTADILAAQGVKVILTRSENVDVSLDDRIAMTRKYAPDLFVSIHCDSAETSALFGTHTFYYKNYSAPLAQSIHTRMAAVYSELYAADSTAVSAADKGIKFFPFAVTRVEECPSVLVECGYLSNAQDCAFINSAAGRLKIADAIANGVLEQLNIKIDATS